MRVLIVACLLAYGLPLTALTIKPLSFTEMVHESAAVVHGRVTEVRAQWTADRRGIESLILVEAVDYLKGGLGETVVVRVPGGQIGTLVNIIPGAPRFTEGDRVVLFLKVNGPAIPVVTGTSQGVYRVSPDPGTGSLLVVPPILDAGVTPAAPRGDVSRRPLALPAFAEAVRRAEAAR